MIRESFDRDWYVTKAGSERPGLSVTLPHDAMVFEARDPGTPFDQTNGYHPGGVYHYTKTFVAPDEWRNASVTVEFEGVYRNAKVLLNGQLVAERPYGYSVFEAKLDGALAYGASNLLEVIVHNDRPSARWYTGSGIYRPVNLLIGGPIRVLPNGLRLATRSVEGDTAVVDVTTDVVNDTDAEREITVVARLTSPSGDELGPAETGVTVGAHSMATVHQLVTVSAAVLWSPDTPALYTASVTLTDGEVVLDVARDDFGIRTLTVDARHGLRVNGKEVKLRGGCVHHDNGVIGAHTLEAAEDRRIRILKSSGYNAVRSSHYPAARSMLRACDRHGVLVMDELTDLWWRAKLGYDYSLDFDEWWERDLEAMVAKDFNHPSVVMYSLGNEVGETATPRGIALNRTMVERTHALDPTRPVTNGINGFFNLFASSNDEKKLAKQATAREKDKPIGKNLIMILNLVMGVFEKAVKQVVRLPAVDKRTRDVFAALDVAGYNYMETRYRRDTDRYPDRVIVGTETASVNTVKIWRDIETMPNVIGDFVWTAWDYIGEAGLAVIEYGRRRRIVKEFPVLLAGTPVIDITGHRQTQSYANEITWRLRRDPFIAVQPVDRSGERFQPNQWRNTNSIRSWSWPGCEGREATVEVHADAHRVDLLLDGNRVGSQRLTPEMEHLATFTLPYCAGELSAVAYDAAGNETGRDRLSSAGAALHLRLVPECERLVADGQDLAYLNIALTDEDGTVHVVRDRRVTVEVEGAGTLLGFGSADPMSTEGFSTPRHDTFQGRALAVVRSGHTSGQVRITASADGCEPATVVLPIDAVR